MKDRCLEEFTLKKTTDETIGKLEKLRKSRRDKMKIKRHFIYSEEVHKYT